MKRISITKRRGLAGWAFILPWFVGLCVFFFQPLLSVLRYSFADFTFDEVSGYKLLPLADGLFSNYRDALTADAEFPQRLASTMTDLLYQTPIIVFFSLFVALLLDQKFRGRDTLRAIFFLPVIVTSGVMATIIKGDITLVDMASSNTAVDLFDASVFTQLMQDYGLPEKIVTAVSAVIADIAGLIWRSGVQILLFMSALLAVPATYHEVAKVEGATAWETFWLVTFPTVSPFVLANTVYTIIDTFTTSENRVIAYITEFSTKDFNYSYASAMSFLYFLLILAVLAAVFLAMRKLVFYGSGSVREKPRRERRGRHG